MPQNTWDFSYSMKVKKAVESHLLEGADDPRFPMLPQRLVADVRKAMPANGIIALDNGVYKIWFARNYKAYEPNTVLLDNALAKADGKIPAAGRMLQWFVLVGWSIYPLGYMLGTDGWYSGMLAGLPLNMDIVYNIGDAINKIGFGMAVWSAAK